MFFMIVLLQLQYHGYYFQSLELYTQAMRYFGRAVEAFQYVEKIGEIEVLLN